MSLRKVTIDKTERIEKMLPDYLAVCLSGMPGVGRKTAVRMLLDKHPEVNAVFCSVDEIENGTVFQRADSERANWFLLRKPEKCVYPESNEGFWRFIRKMSGRDRIFLAVDGLLPESFLEFVWSGIMGIVLPETFWFTEAETYRYLKECRSDLRYREVQYMTGGWAGCIAMLVRLEKQLRDRWTVQELCSRYEIRKYIQDQIIDVLPADELKMLKERAAFPYLNEELVSVLWPDPGKELEERLFVRGAMIYVPEKNCWHIQPALRIAIKKYTSAELCGKAVEWYEQHDRIQDALACCWYLQDWKLYRECLIRNYRRVPFLNYEKCGYEEKITDVPELFYLEWMENYLRQDEGRMEELRQMIPDLLTDVVPEDNEHRKITEILLNIAYTDPEISTKEWIELLREKTDPQHPVRLYFILGESVSFLCGLRDLSDLFACSKKEKKEYAQIWNEHLVPENRMPYRLAELEYEYQTDSLKGQKGDFLSMIPEERGNTPWQTRLGMMYLAYLFADDEDSKARVKKYISHLAEELGKEETPVCRWNAKALLYLAEARWGEREDLLKWIRETGGDIGNETGKTKFYMTAEAKINMYLGNYGHAERILQTLLPWFEKNKSWRWLTEALFQKAAVEWEKGETGQALKTAAQSISVANPYRYVRIYTGYGKQGQDILEEYRKWSEKADTPYYQKKKKYKYGSVLRMPVEDWIDYIIRKAGRQKKYFLDLREEQQNIYRIEKLTVTEQMVLQYLQDGYSNAAISEVMNIKLSTVKSHIYNIYKKLGAATRVQAVQKARQSGLL